jgi:uncharacterized protein GlcG (DUF336 family)
MVPTAVIEGAQLEGHAAPNSLQAFLPNRQITGDRAVADWVVTAPHGTRVAMTATADRAGTVRAVQRADNAGPHTLEASRLKAYTAASAKNSTLAIMEGAQKNPGAANLVNIPGYLLLGGGLPVKAGNEVIGAVGIGGAPGGHLDDQCAQTALGQVQDLLK